MTKEERDIAGLATSTLHPGAQCAKKARSASTVLGKLSRAFHFRNRHTFIRLYRQYLLPHLKFAARAGMEPVASMDKELLEKV
jgi:hypothetical protein